MLQHQPRHPVRRALGRDLGARVFHHVAEVHSGWARRFTGTAIQTLEHVIDKRFRNLCTPLVERTHEINAAARRIHFASKHAIGWT